MKFLSEYCFDVFIQLMKVLATYLLYTYLHNSEQIMVISSDRLNAFIDYKYNFGKSR